MRAIIRILETYNKEKPLNKEISDVFIKQYDNMQRHNKHSVDLSYKVAKRDFHKFKINLAHVQYKIYNCLETNKTIDVNEEVINSTIIRPIWVIFLNNEFQLLDYTQIDPLEAFVNELVDLTWSTVVDSMDLLYNKSDEMQIYWEVQKEENIIDSFGASISASSLRSLSLIYWKLFFLYVKPALRK